MSRTAGCSRLEMSKMTPSPMHAPAIRSRDANVVRSWQPLVGLSELSVGSAGSFPWPGLPPSGKSTGVLTTAASVGVASGTLITEILSCGGLQNAAFALGEYDETYT